MEYAAAVRVGRQGWAGRCRRVVACPWVRAHAVRWGDAHPDLKCDCTARDCPASEPVLAEREEVHHYGLAVCPRPVRSAAADPRCGRAATQARLLWFSRLATVGRLPSRVPSRQAAVRLRAPPGPDDRKCTRRPEARTGTQHALPRAPGRGYPPRPQGTQAHTREEARSQGRRSTSHSSQNHPHCP
jgi:hypothetical protein